MGMDTDGTVHDVTIVICGCAVGFPACIFTAWHGVVLGMRRSRRAIGTGWRRASFIRKLYYSFFLAYCFQTSSASTVMLLH
jgi:hypothetical protein